MRFRMSPLPGSKRWSFSYYGTYTRRWHMSVFRPADKTDVHISINWVLKNGFRDQDYS